MSGIEIIFSAAVKKKLENKNPSVSEREVKECFYNRDGEFFEDNRDEHKTEPSTQWFVSETDKRRTLKIIFVKKAKDIHIKSAYDANKKVVGLYKILSTKKER